jgi:hypothetical protein
MKRDRPPKLRFVAAPLAVACLLVAGCGGSSDNSSSSSGSPTQNVAGPADFRANLIWLMSKHQPELSHVRSDCPHTPPSSFAQPVECRFTATAKGRRLTEKEVKAGPRIAHLLSRPHKVAGTIKVLGVFQPTRTYEFVTNYSPVR